MEYNSLFSFKVLVVAVIISIIVLTSLTMVPNLYSHPVAYSHAIYEVKEDIHSQSLCTDSSDDDDNCLKRRLPKCLIIGFAKCGTYALISFLALHPDIATANDEVGFFNNKFNKGFEWYIAQMPLSKGSQITIEKTPGYVLSMTALERIHEFNSTLKLMIIVRDPVDRVPSLYAHYKEKNDLPTFTKWIKSEEYVNKMNYHQHIAQVYKVFPREQVLVLCEESLEDDPLSVIKEVESFLGLQPAFNKDLFVFNLDKGFYCFNKSHPRYHAISQVLKIIPETGCFSKAKGREHPEISPELMKEVVANAQPYNERLFQLIGKRFNWTQPLMNNTQ
uniref:Sulfotransferase domain-containing protein n=1 Tax=Biomphalaria glabrata TaxID=6526 RepID=A0A2C9JT24_BIOGL